MKMLIRLEADRIRVFRIKKGPRQMVTVSSRLYRIDDELMCRDVHGGDAAVFYRIDDTQPMLPALCPRVVDPDLTRAQIDSAKMSGNKKSIWANLGGVKWAEVLTPLIVVIALIYGFVIG